ncbi:hypothetical protein AcW1_005641 [Taiwanofungus camphoratus]|nr:hypothetical protein AcW2_004406 [Antrodia cinnamomea]KAI0957164.1 hypothetical protein AcW1_005641 [Antrodia cinnamomea]
MAEVRLKREEEEAEQIGMKRKAKDFSGRSSKRKAIDEDAVNVSLVLFSPALCIEDWRWRQDEVYFRVNHEKFNIHIRNKLIEAAATERFNDCTGLVMRATLKATEGRQMRLTDVRSGIDMFSMQALVSYELLDPTSFANIAMQLSEYDDLSAGLLTPTSKKPSSMSLLKDYLGILASADNPTPAGRAASFISLNGSKVQVEFEIVGRRLRRRVLEAITRERHGDDGVRIVRLLLDTGKMDEKQISKIGMMANKDVRPLLSALSADSLISLQEVPKSADRNPTRTFYLWYVDLQKAYSVLLDNLYKTLYNIETRRQAEEEEPGVKAVIEKRQRSDVSQDEERLLTRNEREVLAQWEKKREKLTVLEMRVEEAVFVLRDFGALQNNDE